MRRKFKFGCDPVSQVFDVEARNGSMPLHIGHVSLKYDILTMTARVYTPEASNPKFVIRSNRC